MTQWSTVSEKELLRARLATARARIVRTLDGLSEDDVRRPMTRSCTNLLGLIKHLTGMEYRISIVYGRARELPPGLYDDEIWFGGDMWARPEETKDDILGWYMRACSDTDQVVDEVDLDEVGGSTGGRPGSLRSWLLGLLAHTFQHAGHAEIVRELIDGHNASSDESEEKQQEYFATLLARIRGEVGPEAWDKFRTPEVEARIDTFRRQMSSLKGQEELLSDNVKQERPTRP